MKQSLSLRLILPFILITIGLSLVFWQSVFATSANPDRTPPLITVTAIEGSNLFNITASDPESGILPNSIKTGTSSTGQCTDTIWKPLVNPISVRGILCVRATNNDGIHIAQGVYHVDTTSTSTTFSSQGIIAETASLFTISKSSVYISVTANPATVEVENDEGITETVNFIKSVAAYRVAMHEHPAGSARRCVDYTDGKPVAVDSQNRVRVPGLPNGQLYCFYVTDHLGTVHRTHDYAYQDNTAPFANISPFPTGFVVNAQDNGGLKHFSYAVLRNYNLDDNLHNHDTTDFQTACEGTYTNHHFETTMHNHEDFPSNIFKIIDTDFLHDTTVILRVIDTADNETWACRVFEG